MTLQRSIGLAIAATLVVAAAIAMNEPPPAPNTAPLPLPADAPTLWHQVEECTGRTGRLSRVRLRVWTGPGTMGVGGLPAEEAFIFATGEIVLTARNAQDPRWIRHGMAHALVGVDSGRHDPDVGRRCGGLFRWP